MLDSIPAPAGEMPVVLGPRLGGVLFHEAVGHPLEADAVDKEASRLPRPHRRARRRSPLINGVDDATVAERLGLVTPSTTRARPSQRTVLFDRTACCTGCLYDRHARRQGRRRSTGNGRRQSYAHLPIPRMTNTYILTGTSKPDDILSPTPRAASTSRRSAAAR